MSEQPPPTPNDNPAIWDLVIADMQVRDRLGQERYGVRLQAGNVRDMLLDAYHEALDLCVYLRGAIAERDGAGTMTNEAGEKSYPEIEDGYPTEATLERIKQWAIADGINALLDYVTVAFRLQLGSATNSLSEAEREVAYADPDHRYLRLATGGWSGCEDVISAFQQNENYLYALTWQFSAAGGLHIFRYMPQEEPA